ncbi:MAG: peptidylprolyl isomerase [Chitinispirillia bacterium]|nr:peptidylprolyl isomerase [Chitinispirillia bacterium]MCL2267915.1 peptidylprolyl isomerase [Chitinispirillia bacterium]
MRLFAVIALVINMLALPVFARGGAAASEGHHNADSAKVFAQTAKADSAQADHTVPAQSAQADSAVAQAGHGSVDGEPEEREDTEIAEPAAPAAPSGPARIAALGHPGRLDGIAAVVGGEIILQSELEAYAYMRLAAMGGNPDNIDTKALLNDCLDELIDNKVLLVRAMEDSTIVVRSDEVESMLNNQINSIMRQNNLNLEQFEMALRTRQGTTLARFKTEMRRAIREQLHKQKLQQRYYFGVSVNRRDVELFFAQYRDSLPEIGESFELHKLSLRLAASDSVRQAAFDKIRSVKQQLDAGGDFAELAKKYSDSPDGPSGGDLGYLEKGSTSELVFEEHAFSLPVGRVSEPFETRLGFHILLVEEKRDRRVKLRQIMVRHAPTGQEREAVAARLDSLRQSVTVREEFEAWARTISADNATRTRGGALGWLSLLEMPPAVRNAVMNLEAGQISQPVNEDNMLTIYMVADRVDSRRLTLESDYPAIAEKARDIAAQKQLLENVRKWREKVFIDVRI